MTNKPEKQTARRIQLIVSLVVISWLFFTLIHELGHVFAALATGGEVQRVIWTPIAFSRTDVQPNPSPLIVVWSGPVFGVLLPMILERLADWLLRSIHYMFAFFAGFCLIANGAYIGLGGFDEVGDAGEMLRHGSPLWVMILFGLLCVALGFYMWHRASPWLGFGNAEQRKQVPLKHARRCFAFAIGLVIVSLLVSVS